MKKILALLMSLALALSMCACAELENLKNVELPPLPNTGESAQPEDSPDPEEPTEAETEGDNVTQPEQGVADRLITVKINATSLEEYDPAEGSRLILSFSYDTPHVTIADSAEAAEKINEYIAMLDETFYTGNDYGAGTATGYNMMLELAEDNYSFIVGTGAEEMNYELVCSRSCSVTRADGRVLSLMYNSYEFTGGVHGAYVSRGYVFDTESGDRLSLSGLTDDYQALEEFLASYMLNKAGDSYYEERIVRDMLPDGDLEAALRGMIREGSWCLTDEGLSIWSDIYELGPYAAGICDFVIPYEELKEYISADLIPGEKSGSGEFSVSEMDKVEDGSIEIIDRVIADEAGEELCLKVSGTVYDVRISRANYADKFYEGAQLMQLSSMSDCALQISAEVPEGMPNVMISYKTAGGEEHRLLLAYDGVDGGAELVDDGIEAVG